MVSRGRDGEGGITKGQEKTFVGDGCVHCLDCGDGFLEKHLGQMY